MKTKQIYQVFFITILILFSYVPVYAVPNLSILNKNYVAITTGNGIASGVIIVVNNDKYVLTVAHAVIDELAINQNGNVPAKLIELTFFNGVKSTAVIFKRDPLYDLALLTAENIPPEVPGIPLESFADSSKIKFGDTIYKIGTPCGVFDIPAMGLVANCENRSKLLISMNVLYFGDSGGPVFNEAGELVGITQMVYCVEYEIGDKRVQIPPHIGTIIPSNFIKERISAMCGLIWVR